MTAVWVVASSAPATVISVPVPLFDPLYRELRLADNLGLLADPLRASGPLSRAEMFRLLEPTVRLDAEDQLLPLPLDDSLGVTRSVSFRVSGARNQVTPWGVFWRKSEYPETFEWQFAKRVDLSASSLTGSDRAPRDLSMGGDRSEGLALERDGWFYLEQDWLAVSASFRLRFDRHAVTVRPLVLSARTGWKNLRVSIGREPLWWGQGVHGNLMLTTNARPIDHLRVESETPWRLPWVLRHVGEWQASWMVGRLDDPGRSDFPNPWLTGGRLDLSPASWLVLGVTRTVMFAGEGSGFSWSLGSLWDLFWANNENRTGGFSGDGDADNRAGVDASVYLWPLLRHVPVLDGGRIYGEHGGEDSPQSGFLPSAPASTVGIELVARGVLVRGEWSDFREEERNIWYTHHRYRDGYTYRDRIIGHPVGGDARQWSVDAEVPAGEWGLITAGWERREVGFHTEPGKSPSVSEPPVPRGIGDQFVLGVDKYLGAFPGRIRLEARYLSESGAAERLGPRENYGVSLLWSR